MREMTTSLRGLRLWLLAAALVAAACTQFDPKATEAAEALARGELDRARELYRTGADVEAVFEDGYTALIMVAGEGSVEAVRLLLEAGANPDVQGTNGNSAMIVAATRGRFEVVRALVEAEANPRLVNHAGETALTAASSRGYEAIAGLLADPG